MPSLPPSSAEALTVCEAASHSELFDITGAETFMATSHTSGTARRLTSTERARRWMRIVGMSILTGHTSPQAPHREEAKGRVWTGSSSASPCVSWGVMIEPIGPG